MSLDMECLWRWQVELKAMHKWPVAIRPRCVGVTAPDCDPTLILTNHWADVLQELSASTFYPENGNSILFWNNEKHLQGYLVSEGWSPQPLLHSDMSQHIGFIVSLCGSVSFKLKNYLMSAVSDYRCFRSSQVEIHRSALAQQERTDLTGKVSNLTTKWKLRICLSCVTSFIFLFMCTFEILKLLMTHNGKQ
jgi:hypothetical protein